MPVVRDSWIFYLRKRDKLAWCAGFFDGEGYVGVKSTGKSGKALAVNVSQKTKPLLERFLAWTEVPARLGGPYYKNHKNGICTLQINVSTDVLKLYERLAPWLGPVKTKQFKDAINVWMDYKKKSGRVQNARKT